MASLNEIVHSIADKLGKPTDFLLLQNLKFSVINYRALFIRQDFTKTSHFNPLLIQDLGCITMEKVDSAECCTIESECLVNRTTLEIPNPIRFKGAEDFVFVGGIDKRTRFTLSLPEEVPYLEYNKYSTGLIRYYYMNKRIYVTDNNLSHINVRGIFEDPRAASKFKRCDDDESCYTDDSTFPCPADMIIGITNGIITGELKILQESNDGKEVKTGS